MAWSSANPIFDDTAKIVTKLWAAKQITEEYGTEILTVVAKTLCDADWDTLDESWDEFPGNPMVEAALKAQWPEIDSDGE